MPYLSGLQKIDILRNVKTAEVRRQGMMCCVNKRWRLPMKHQSVTIRLSQILNMVCGK